MCEATAVHMSCVCVVRRGGAAVKVCSASVSEMPAGSMAIEVRMQRK